MQRTELFPPAEGPVDIRFRYITSQARGGEKVGTQIELATEPPTLMRVYPERLIYRRADFNRKVEGETHLRWGGTKLKVDARFGNRVLLVDHTGKTVLVRDPETATPTPHGEIDLFTGEEIPHKKAWTTGINYNELFKDLNTTDSRTFDDLSVGLGLRFFIEDADLTLEQYAQQAHVSLNVIHNLTIGRTTAPRDPFDAFLYGFGWEKDDPRAEILYKLYRRSKPHANPSTEREALEKWRIKVEDAGETLI
jgi:hypothetical protein